MWMYFLFYLLVNSLLTASVNTTKNPLWSLVNTSNVSTKKLIEGTPSPLPDRQGYERGVLVVLPVMQGNSELTNSDLQMLYTKTPLTTIINEKVENQASDINKRSTTSIKITKTSGTRPATPVTISPISAPNTTGILLEQNTVSTATLIKRDDYHYPHIELLSTKTVPKIQKPPLDYGYPESFKFIQEMNDLPKNHKPEWAQSDLAEAESKKSTTTERFTKKDPFQMFESVKPLEINKLLSLKPIVVSVTESITEEITLKNKQESVETSHATTKRPFNKRPTKKPQKAKVNPQKLNNAEFAPFIPFITMSTDKITEFDFKSNIRNTQSSIPSNSPIPTIAIRSSTQTPLLQPSTIKLDGNLYSTAKYSTRVAESTKVFLPTPYSPTSDQATVPPIQSDFKFVKPSSENWLSIVNPITKTTAKTSMTRTKPSTIEIAASSSTTTSTTFSPNLNRLNIKTPTSPIMEFGTSLKVIPKVEPADLISLTKILDEHFDKKYTLHALANGIPQTTTTNPHFPTDMLTSDMKNMLIALGLLKPEKDLLSPLIFITSTAPPSNSEAQYHDSLYVHQEHIAPTVDPNSYTIFKKLPINYEKPQVSNDMKNLLSSFGLLPSTKSSHLGRNSILTRISRQQKLENSNILMNMLNDKMQQPFENSGFIKPMVYQMNRKGHVFQPSMHLEKLTDPQQVEKIRNALKMIQMLYTSKDAQNHSIEELEQKLHNVTTLLPKETFLDGNATNMPQLMTELLSTMKNMTKVESSTTSKSNTSSTTTDKPLQISHSLHTSPTTSNSTGKGKTYSSISTTNSQSRQLGNSQMTTTPSIPTTVSTAFTMSLIPTSTPHSTVGSPSIATAASAKTSATPFTTASTESEPAINTSIKPATVLTKIELSLENSSSSGSTSSITPAIINLFPEQYNEISYTPDMSFISSVKLSHNKNNTMLVMPPPPNPLSIEELQHLLETNRNNVKRQQPQDVTTSSTTLNIVAEVTPNNISSTTDVSTMSEISKNSSSINNSINDSTSSGNSSIRSTTSSSSRHNSNNNNGSTEGPPIKADNSSDNNQPLEALADSFGGENEEQVDSWQANAKPNGLYFLLDWNTFLSVGEEDKRPIRIRFSPRAGNPRNFMPISVP